MVDDTTIDVKRLREEMLREIFIEYLQEKGLRLKMGGERDHSKQMHETVLMAQQSALSLIPLNTTGYIEEDDPLDEIMVADPKSDVEKFIMQKDLYENLSQEARFVVKTVCNNDAVMSPSGKITKSTVVSYIRRKKWKKPIIERVDSELREFVSSF